MTVGYADGSGGNSWRKTVRAELEAEAAKCPNIKPVKYTDGKGDTQTAISNVKSLVAQGVDIILSYPDAGPTMNAAYRQATEAGVVVIPFAVGTDYAGTPGTDFLQIVTEDVVAKGRVKGEWMVKALGGKGNIVFLGGTPGNPTSKAEFEGVKQGIAGSQVKLLTDAPIDTNWDPAQAQKVMAGLLTKYPNQIDGVVADYGLGSVGAIRAYQQAGQPLVPWAAEDGNDFACTWQKLAPSNPRFQIATASARTWLIRVALRKGIAQVQGIPDNEPSIVTLPLFEDSLDPAKAPQCQPGLPPDALLSAQLSLPELQQLLNAK
ncbi:substrate-binding domain-containing protein [Saccharopolyspora phatthalungensis]|uniref:Ribose transport system substrate-binding protein n=1 Tax=Saccharopolyspora phatthalungensis TaxID=664693 RepID=A0A840Q9S5_9PSEU|nr:substrate-binding domain-containing protein [Saccharopolyspora phatthalungensis]MBB5157186.1 ribose transport system substrate-binding protein [Saccharopolyspora phatthalungensis]